MMHNEYITPAGFWEGEKNPLFHVIIYVLQVLFLSLKKKKFNDMVEDSIEEVNKMLTDLFQYQNRYS